MRREIYFDAAQFSVIKSKIKGNLDNPKLDLKEAFGKLLFSGWFITTDDNFSLRVKYSQKQADDHYLNISRPDVIKHLGLSNHNQFCGFQFHIDTACSNQIEVAICLEGKEYTIWYIKESEFDEAQIESVKSYWESFYQTEIHNANKAGPSEKEVQILTSLFALSDANSIYSSLLLKGVTNFDSSADLLNFILSFQDSYWAMDSIKHASKYGELTYNLIGEKHKCYCIGSYAVEDYNFILFGGLDVQFYIVQHCTNALIIFPTIYKCMSLFADDIASYAMGKIEKLFIELGNLKKLGVPFPRNLVAKFDGISVSHSRPYHFVYDYLHGLDYLSSHISSINSVSSSGFDFLEVSHYFENVEKSYSIDQTNLNLRSCSLNTFYLMPCLQYVNGDHDRDLTSLSKTLRAKSAEQFLTTSLENKVSKSNYELIFWVGISVEKRSWIEQVDGISLIISRLHERYKKILVMIDGRTLPLTSPTKADSNIIGRENVVFNQIKDSLPEVDFINLIGRTMSEKILHASLIDLFLTSFATDSLYASCIQNKHGVVYVAPSIGDLKIIHVHKNAIEIPPEKVNEVNSKGKTWHETSVSMNWLDVYDCIEQVLDREV